MELYRATIGRRRPLYGSKSLLKQEIVEALHYTGVAPSSIRLDRVRAGGHYESAERLLGTIIAEYTKGGR